MSKGRILLVCLIWVALIGAGAVAWKTLVAPAREEAVVRELTAEQRAAEEAEARRRAELEAATRDPSRYDATVTLALDGFSGYAVLRSDAFRRELADRGVRLRLKDDGADYAARLEGLADGTAPVAAFTVDALLKHSQLRGDRPATVVAVIAARIAVRLAIRVAIVIALIAAAIWIADGMRIGELPQIR